MKSEKSDKSVVQTMAEILASHTPAHLGQPTTPPISWAQTGDIVSVVLADGRKVKASIQEVNEILFKELPPAAAPKKPAKPKTNPKGVGKVPVPQGKK